jgi:hypothetical protein
MGHAVSTRSLRPRIRWAFEAGDLRADVVTFRPTELQAVRFGQAIDAGDDLSSLQTMADFARSNVCAVHSLARGEETIEAPTADELVESLDAEELGKLTERIIAGPNADFAKPA